MTDFPNLIYVPILHTPREVGDSFSFLKDEIFKKGTPVSLATIEQEKAVNEMWDGICEKIKGLNISAASFRIYQDNLPVCGREKEITAKLAEKGSRNHKVILELVNKGARLEGTEDPNLLIEEYDYLTELFRGSRNSELDYKAAMKKYINESAELMKKRDVFIANRIKDTMQDGETALIFIGVRHQLEKLLNQQFIITYIIYRLPFKRVKDIYFK